MWSQSGIYANKIATFYRGKLGLRTTYVRWENVDDITEVDVRLIGVNYKRQPRLILALGTTRLQMVLYLLGLFSFLGTLLVLKMAFWKFAIADYGLGNFQNIQIFRVKDFPALTSGILKFLWCGIRAIQILEFSEYCFQISKTLRNWVYPNYSFRDSRIFQDLNSYYEIFAISEFSNLFKFNSSKFRLSSMKIFKLCFSKWWLFRKHGISETFLRSFH